MRVRIPHECKQLRTFLVCRILGEDLLLDEIRTQLVIFPCAVNIIGRIVQLARDFARRLRHHRGGALGHLVRGIAVDRGARLSGKTRRRLGVVGVLALGQEHELLARAFRRNDALLEQEVAQT